MKQPEYQGPDGPSISGCIEDVGHAGAVHRLRRILPPSATCSVYSDSERDLGNAGEGQAFMAQYQFFAEALTRVMKPGRMACVHCTDLPTRKESTGISGCGFLRRSDPCA